MHNNWLVQLARTIRSSTRRRADIAGSEPLRRKSDQANPDDLFQRGTMSFGEHLEELRKTFAKSAVWLGLGTLVGLFFADSLVLAIKAPLEDAIRESEIEQAKIKFHKANGFEPPLPVSQLISEHGLLPEIVFEDTTPLAVETFATREQMLNADTWSVVDLDSISRLRPRVEWRRMPTRVVALASTEPFLVWFKAGLVAGVVLGSPGIFWHLWQFLAAGLYPQERKQVYWYLPISIGLFLAGTSLAFFVLLRLVLGYLIRYSFSLEVELTPRLADYMSFALFLPIGFGVAFQLPIVMLGIQRFGIVPIEAYVENWRAAVLLIAFLSMVLTPAEFYSMLGMFIPLTGLYFLGIALCKYMPGK